MRAAIFVALIACGKSEQPEKPDKPEANKPEPHTPEPNTPNQAVASSAQPELTASMDGKPITVRSVIAVRDSDDQIKLLVTNFEQGCEVPTSGSSSRSSEPTDLDLTLRIGRFLHADGTLGWAVRGKYWHPSREKGSWTKQIESESGGEPLPKELVLDAAAGKSFELPLAIELDMDDEDLKKKRTLSIKGTAKVTGCGDYKLKRDLVLPPPQAGATIKIATQELPIRGAALAIKKTGERELTVATGEVICVEGTDYASAKWPDLGIHLTWGPDGKAWSASHDGGWVAWAGNAKFGTLSVTPNRPPSGAKEMSITLAGATTIGGYPVELKGKIKALVCQPPP